MKKKNYFFNPTGLDGSGQWAGLGLPEPNPFSEYNNIYKVLKISNKKVQKFSRKLKKIRKIKKKIENFPKIQEFSENIKTFRKYKKFEVFF